MRFNINFSLILIFYNIGRVFRVGCVKKTLIKAIVFTNKMFLIEVCTILY